MQSHLHSRVLIGWAKFANGHLNRVSSGLMLKRGIRLWRWWGKTNQMNSSLSHYWGYVIYLLCLGRIKSLIRAIAWLFFNYSLWRFLFIRFFCFFTDYKLFIFYSHIFCFCVCVCLQIFSYAKVLYKCVSLLSFFKLTFLNF